MNRKSSCGYATHFLLPMNEVNFVISKKIFFIDFLDELELFIGEKQVLNRFFKDAFKLDTSPFGSLKELVQLELFLYFDLGNKFRRVAAIRIFGSFFTYMSKIY
jgi:hypothetical protein